MTAHYVYDPTAPLDAQAADVMRIGLCIGFATTYPEIVNAVAVYTNTSAMAARVAVSEGRSALAFRLHQDDLLATRGASEGRPLAALLKDVPVCWYALAAMIAQLSWTIDQTLAYNQSAVGAAARSPLRKQWPSTAASIEYRRRAVSICLTQWLRVRLPWTASARRTPAVLSKIVASFTPVTTAAGTIHARMPELSVPNNDGYVSPWEGLSFRSPATANDPRTGHRLWKDLRRVTATPRWWDVFVATLNFQHMGATFDDVNQYLTDRYVLRNKRLTHVDVASLAPCFEPTPFANTVFYRLDNALRQEPFATAGVGFIEATAGWWNEKLPIPADGTGRVNPRDYAARQRAIINGMLSDEKLDAAAGFERLDV